MEDLEVIVVDSLPSHPPEITFEWRNLEWKIVADAGWYMRRVRDLWGNEFDLQAQLQVMRASNDQIKAAFDQNAPNWIDDLSARSKNQFFAVKAGRALASLAHLSPATVADSLAALPLGSPAYRNAVVDAALAVCDKIRGSTVEGILALLEHRKDPVHLRSTAALAALVRCKRAEDLQNTLNAHWQKDNMGSLLADPDECEIDVLAHAAALVPDPDHLFRAVIDYEWNLSFTADRERSEPICPSPFFAAVLNAIDESKLRQLKDTPMELEDQQWRTAMSAAVDRVLARKSFRPPPTYTMAP